MVFIFNKGKLLRLSIIKQGGIGLHMGRYGLILGPIEAYTQNIAIGTIVDPIVAHQKIKNTKHIKTSTLFGPKKAPAAMWTPHEGF